MDNKQDMNEADSSENKVQGRMRTHEKQTQSTQRAISRSMTPTAEPVRHGSLLSGEESTG